MFLLIALNQVKKWKQSPMQEQWTLTNICCKFSDEIIAPSACLGPTSVYILKVHGPSMSALLTPQSFGCQRNDETHRQTSRYTADFRHNLCRVREVEYAYKCNIPNKTYQYDCFTFNFLQWTCSLFETSTWRLARRSKL